MGTPYWQVLGSFFQGILLPHPTPPPIPVLPSFSPQSLGKTLNQRGVLGSQMSVHSPSPRGVSTLRGITLSFKGPQAQGAGLLAGPQGQSGSEARGCGETDRCRGPGTSIPSPEAQDCRTGKKSLGIVYFQPSFTLQRKMLRCKVV